MTRNGALPPVIGLVHGAVPTFVLMTRKNGAARYVALTGGETGVPGLVVTPVWDLAHGRYGGGWQVTHHLTGARVAGPYPAPGTAYQVATALGQVTGAQWNRSVPVKRDDVLSEVERITAQPAEAWVTV